LHVLVVLSKENPIRQVKHWVILPLTWQVEQDVIKEQLGTQVITKTYGARHKVQVAADVQFKQLVMQLMQVKFDAKYW